MRGVRFDRGHRRWRVGHTAVFCSFTRLTVFSLIAIMLGQLQMDVDDSITMYNKLWHAAHHPEPHQLQEEARYNSARLQVAIRKVMEAHGRSDTEAFAVAADHGCRVFVYSLPRNHNVDG